MGYKLARVQSPEMSSLYLICLVHCSYTSCAAICSSTQDSSFHSLHDCINTVIHPVCTMICTMVCAVCSKVCTVVSAVGFRQQGCRRNTGTTADA